MMELRFQIDLGKIEGGGQFPCPICGQIISPDDESGVTYDILGTKVAEDDTIEEIIVRCKKCGNQIHLTGFDLLKQVGCSDEMSPSLLR